MSGVVDRIVGAWEAWDRHPRDELTVRRLEEALRALGAVSVAREQITARRREGVALRVAVEQASRVTPAPAADTRNPEPGRENQATPAIMCTRSPQASGPRDIEVVEEFRAFLAAAGPPPPVRRPTAGVGTHRTWRRPTGRTMAFADRAAGQWAAPDGRAGKIPRNATPATILGALPDDVARVYLVGPSPAVGADGLDRWAQRCGEWQAAHHRLGRPESFTLAYSRDGRRAQIGRAAQWFGDSPLTVAQAAGAWRLLAAGLAKRFDRVDLAAAGTTPASVGLHLVEVSIPEGREWPVLDAADRELIRSTMGQGRIECCWQGGPVPGLVHLDGRIMYPALARNLPAGPIYVDEGTAPPTKPDGRPDLYYPARYLIDVRPPAGWDHVGLVGVRDDTGAISYPTEGVHQCWVDGAELWLLDRWRWPYRIRRRILFTPYTGRGPLDGWATRLLELRDSVTHDDQAVIDAVRAALRAIAIRGIGKLVSPEALLTRSAPIDQPDAVPAGAIRPRVEGDRLVWETGGGGEHLAHPEWAAAIYAKCRVRLLDGPGDTGALHLDRGAVVGFDTDCLYTTLDPGWVDDGKPGRLRVKATVTGPLPAPADIKAVRALRG